MNLICSPLGMVDPMRPKAGTLHIKEAGFDDILLDMNMYCSSWDLENYGTANYRKRNFTQELNARSSLVKTSALNAATQRTDMNNILRKIVKEELCYSIAHGCEIIIVQPLFTGISFAKGDRDAVCHDNWTLVNDNREVLWETNKQYYLDLLQAAKAQSEKDQTFRILLQNQYKVINGQFVRGICSDAAEACQWVDELNAIAGEEIFGMCVDTGVLNVCRQDAYEYIHTLGSRVKAVILRENDGLNDDSLLPFTSAAHRQSQMDWLGIIRGLREIAFDGSLILEFPDTACAFSPLLRPSLLQLAKSVAEYFKWQIEIENLLKKHDAIVLFGAGNMCRNYMKCYGEKYPPLFTCDNNKNLWGTWFEGLEIKPPDALKELPKDCVVFICNVYYKEIEQQLRDIGITNAIEYFNDEYMPNFYFDRIER